MKIIYVFSIIDHFFLESISLFDLCVFGRVSETNCDTEVIIFNHRACQITS
jgi:hypothetical protein